ncbi:MAG: sulfatase [Pirellulaceae bacterium]|nr:sulfatase [Pirellulaceae bacterium]
MRRALVFCIVAFCCISVQAADKPRAVQPTPPNIVFIMSDDHAAHALRCYGNKIISTPNIDRLAGQGMRFTMALGVHSLCAPSRAVLLTGKHSHLNGMTGNFTRFDGAQQTFPKLLQAAGYETAIVGKWHLGYAPPTGFDYYKIMRGQGAYYDCKFLETGKDWHIEKGYLTNVITDTSIDWLKNRRSDKPFCLMVHHKAPHGPYDHELRHAKLFEDLTIPEPDTLYDDWSTRDPLRTGKYPPSKMLDGSWPRENYQPFLDSVPNDRRARISLLYQMLFKDYFRLVVSLDENVGRLLDYLDQAGLNENTIVIYTSDNGFFLGEHGLYNKMWMYEESLKLPLIVRYPGVVKPGSVNDDLVCNLDFASTFLDFAGAEVPADMQGKSIRPLLLGERPADWRQSVYYHYHGAYDMPEHYGLRTKTHKLIHFPKYGDGNYWELFDLDNDPRELHNIYDNPAQAERVAELKAELKRLHKTLNDE